MIVWTAGWQASTVPEKDGQVFPDRLAALEYMLADLRETANTHPDTDVALEYEGAVFGLEGRDADGGDWERTFSDGYRYYIEAVEQ